MRLISVVCFPAAALVLAESHAHHSSATFDEEVTASIEGTIVDVDWVNPHVYFWIEAENEDGELVTWEVEGQSPTFFRRAGRTREDFVPGIRYSVTGNPHRDADRATLLLRFIEPAGEATPVEEQTPLLAALMAKPENVEPASGLDGTWAATINEAAIGAVFTSDTISLTENGRAAVDSYVEAEENPGARLHSLPGADDDDRAGHQVDRSGR